MHIPDGFIAPQAYVPASAVAGVLWGIGASRLRRRLDPSTLPRLAVAAAVAFALMLVTVPLPGGTTVHVSGVGMLAVLFGVWPAFLSLSLVLTIQAFVMGHGGVTTLPINALALGMCGTLAARFAFIALRPRALALFVAGWVGTVVPAVVLALVLGWQPILAHDTDGRPLFFPFGWSVTLPAVVVPHLLVGLADGALAVLAWRYLHPRTAPSGGSP